MLPADFTLLQVVPELETGGAEQTTLDVARAVIDAGGRALVATRGGRMTARLEADGARLTQMPVQSKNPLVMLGNAARLVDLIRRERVSLIHARSRAPAFSALWAAQATRTPFVATYHGVYKARSSLKRWYNAVMTRGDLVIANSDYTRDHVLAEHHLDPAKITRKSLRPSVFILAAASMIVRWPLMRVSRPASKNLVRRSPSTMPQSRRSFSSLSAVT